MAERTVTPTGAPLSLHLHRERGGPTIGVEPVAGRDLLDALAELWFQDGSVEATPLADVEATVRLVEREDPEVGRYTAGFELHRRGSGGTPAVRYFARESLEHVAARGARRLVEEGRLEETELYYYGLAQGEAPDALVRGPEGRGVLEVAEVPIRRVLDLVLEDEDKEAVGVADDAYPVFFTRSARRRAERVSRKGGDVSPPVETGGLLLGPLCRCPETGQVFAVVEQVIEATDSEATKYSLTYSGPTWARIQAMLRARRAQPETRHHRVLGQCHGHNFLPFEGAEPCEACALVAVCTRSSAYLSSEDRTWCRAVFSGEPWQLSQVFGLDARGRPTETFYGQRGGALARRGYRVIDEPGDEWLTRI